MSSSSDDESEETLEEPKLKYERMGNDLLEILKKDAASCIALHSKFVALGTHWGTIHILDHLGNNITMKQFSSHNTTVTSIALDETGEFIASCSDDGVVSVTGLYSDDHNQSFTLDQPVKSIALEPGYAGSSSKQLVFGTDKLFLSEKTWLRRVQRTVLHQGEGVVRIIKWRGQLIAWANDMGVKIYDTKQHRRITHISRSKSDTINESYRAELYPAHITWKDDKTIMVGWANDIKICSVLERTNRESHQPSKYCVISHLFKTDFACCGIAPLGDQIVVLAYVPPKDEKDDKHYVAPSPRPQLRIIEPDPEKREAFMEVSRDALSIRGYQSYRCNDYSLEQDGSELYVVSPKDIVLAQKRDEDDRVTWLLQTKQHREALEAVKQCGKRLKKHSYLEVGMNYISYLMENQEYGEAAKVCSQVLGNNITLWEQLAIRFHDAGQLTSVAPYLPTGDFRLTSKCYELVLEEFLKKKDAQGFTYTLKYWPNELYDLREVINKVLRYLDRDPHNSMLLSSLARLYAADNRFDRALGIYLRLQHPDTFELIRKHKLYKALQENVLPLMQFGQSEAVELLLDNMEYVPIEKVVAELENKPNHLHRYLHALFLRDSHLGSEYHSLQVRLYADFDRSKLLPFLKSSNYIDLEEALKICEDREYIDEQVFLLSRMGNASKALDLITEHASDVDRAVEFCKEQNDSELWDELINKSIHKPNFIRGLLQNIGTHVDPIILIRRIPNNLEIPGLRDSIVKILQHAEDPSRVNISTIGSLADYSMQTALWFNCRRILSSDVLALSKKQMLVNRRPLRVDDDRPCDSCGRPLMTQSDANSWEFPVIVGFLCKHAFHDKCLPPNSMDKCSICSGNIRQT